MSKSPAKAPPPLDAGDIFPRFRLPHPTGGEPFDSRADTIAGKPQVLAFARGAGDEPAATLLAARAEFEALGAVPLAVLRLADTSAGDSAAVDRDGRLTAHCIGPTGAGLAVVGRNGHVLTLAKGEGSGPVDAARALLKGLAADARSGPAERQAPVLLVPDVLSRADCQRLITVYNMDGNVFVEPGHGVKGQKTDYKMRIPEYGRKDRIDHWVVNPKTMALINDRLQRRLFPEIQKAFHYKITRHETYRIGCYEGERGGELHGHRDNTEARVAHRRFACSINLNAEAFEGGELAFPEFGDQRFSPRTGEAVVFSSSLLHEPLHVTKGRRLVLLAFLFGET